MFTRPKNQFRNYEYESNEFFDQFIEQVLASLVCSFVIVLIVFVSKTFRLVTKLKKIQNSWVEKLVVGSGEQDENKPMLNKIFV